MQKSVKLFRHLLWTVVLFYYLFLDVHVQACTQTGWFGDSCQYKCHCTNDNCDFTTGECTGGLACVKGWFGPACQYVDLTTTNTNVTSPSWLYDGDDATCNNGQTSPVTIQLETEASFAWIRLYVRDPDDLRDIDVQFDSVPSTGAVPCRYKRVAAINDRTLDIYCYQAELYAQQVIFVGHGVASLCSVYISGGRNIALKQSTTIQSTTQSQNTDSSKAVDGNTDGVFSHGSCTQTADGDNDPTWNVTFRYPQQIYRYVLFNRVDDAQVQQRLMHFNLTSYTEDGSEVYTFQNSETKAYGSYTVRTPGTLAAPISKVTITATHVAPPDLTPILTLCEVEMYGETVCPRGHYGRECKESCDYCTNNVCFATTGACQDGCAEGYITDKGQTPYVEDRYGPGCALNCSSECANQLCNVLTGVCDDCPSGKTGDMCEETCPKTRHGPRCIYTCFSRCENQECDAVTGYCDDCPPGTTGDLCFEDCPKETHGPRCIYNCSSQCENQECDAVTGVCDDCPSGKTGDLCDEECPKETHGPRCIYNCSSQCDNQECDAVTGVCDDCPSGKTGDLCDEVCPKETHGPRCIYNCSSQCDNQECDAVTGVCDECPSGKTGDLCDEDCPDTKYGPRCVNTCHRNCVGQTCRGDVGRCDHCPDDKIGVYCDQELCPEGFCKKEAKCIGASQCDCSDDFYGSSCQYSEHELPVTDFKFLGIVDNHIITPTGNLTFHGPVALNKDGEDMSLAIAAGGYVQLPGAIEDACLDDIDNCTSGFTVTNSHSFSNTDSGGTNVVLTTGAGLEEGAEGVSLYYQSGNVYCYVVTSTQEWSIVRPFNLVDNEWYDMTVSWHLGQGLDLVQGNKVLASTNTPITLTQTATVSKPLLIGSDDETSSKSVMNVKGLTTSPVYWKELQRSGVYFQEKHSTTSVLEIAQVVGIAVGCVAALVLTILAAVGVCHYVRKTPKNNESTTPGPKLDNDYLTPSNHTYSMGSNMVYVDYNEGEIPYIPAPDYEYDYDYITLESETTFTDEATRDVV